MFHGSFDVLWSTRSVPLKFFYDPWRTRNVPWKFLMFCGTRAVFHGSFSCSVEHVQCSVAVCDSPWNSCSSLIYDSAGI